MLVQRTHTVGPLFLPRSCPPSTMLIGFGCCRLAVGNDLLPWSHTPKTAAVGIRAKQVGVMSTRACAAICAGVHKCTHYELNMHGAQEGHGHCWLFNSGGQRVRAACDTTSGRMLCFAASDGGHTTRSSLAPRHNFSSSGSSKKHSAHMFSGSREQLCTRPQRRPCMVRRASLTSLCVSCVRGAACLVSTFRILFDPH